jgi:hypothetical protein
MAAGAKLRESGFAMKSHLPKHLISRYILSTDAFRALYERRKL